MSQMQSLEKQQRHRLSCIVLLPKQPNRQSTLQAVPAVQPTSINLRRDEDFLDLQYARGYAADVNMMLSNLSEIAVVFQHNRSQRRAKLISRNVAPSAAILVVWLPNIYVDYYVGFDFVPQMDEHQRTEHWNQAMEYLQLSRTTSQYLIAPINVQ
ncbi:hypothetical protein L596_001948 [Steinernema carpocapsae]|uniref:Uncharacterized protein n=1 Tax=Steinernema carpocapsae TaxID=34508 RepID=A0A4U8UMP8_STECR|nr:hypothetical protein L596_001948 [Steinernema carpocapsae]